MSTLHPGTWATAATSFPPWSASQQWQQPEYYSSRNHDVEGHQDRDAERVREVQAREKERTYERDSVLSQLEFMNTLKSKLVSPPPTGPSVPEKMEALEKKIVGEIGALKGVCDQRWRKEDEEKTIATARAAGVREGEERARRETSAGLEKQKQKAKELEMKEKEEKSWTEKMHELELRERLKSRAHELKEIEEQIRREKLADLESREDGLRAATILRADLERSRARNREAREAELKREEDEAEKLSRSYTRSYTPRHQRSSEAARGIDIDDVSLIGRELGRELGRSLGTSLGATYSRSPPLHSDYNRRPQPYLQSQQKSFSPSFYPSSGSDLYLYDISRYHADAPPAPPQHGSLARDPHRDMLLRALDEKYESKFREVKDRQDAMSAAQKRREEETRMREVVSLEFERGLTPVRGDLRRVESRQRVLEELLGGRASRAGREERGPEYRGRYRYV